MKTVRIGGGAACAEDRVDHAVDMIERGNLDYVIFDSLSENELSQVTIKKLQDPSLPGYDLQLEKRMTKVLPAVLKNKVKLVSNMGSTNPLAAAEWVRDRTIELGYKNVKIAAVTGDWVVDYLRTSDCVTVEGKKQCKEFGEDLVTANAYIPCQCIVDALDAGADIVLTGRVGDAAMALGALRHAFGWKADEWDKLATGMMVGHMLECSAQLTGGYYADPPYKEVPYSYKIGYPIAEVSEDLSVVFTKIDGSGGVVNEDVCKEQALYEVHDPENYYHADVTVDLSHIQLRQVGKDRVLMVPHSIKGKPHTDRLKVSMGVKEGYFTSCYVWYAGPGALSRAKYARDEIYARFDYLGYKPDADKIFIMGVDGIYGDAPGVPKDLDPWEVGLRMAARSHNKKELIYMVAEVTANMTNEGPAACSCENSSLYVRDVVAYYHTFISRDVPQLKITYLEV